MWLLSGMVVPQPSIGCSHPSYVQVRSLASFGNIIYRVICGTLSWIATTGLSICSQNFGLTHLYLLPSIWKMWVTLPKDRNCFSSWGSQPIWKICSSNWIISPRIGVNIKIYMKPPPSFFLVDYHSQQACRGFPTCYVEPRDIGFIYGYIIFPSRLNTTCSHYWKQKPILCSKHLFDIALTDLTDLWILTLQLRHEWKKSLQIRKNKTVLLNQQHLKHRNF